MKLEIKYNKTVLREFQNRLKMRVKALPTLKNKEAALRALVFDARRKTDEAAAVMRDVLQRIESWQGLWNEYDFSLLKIKDIQIKYEKIAGIAVPNFIGIATDAPELPLTLPDWFHDGLAAQEEFLTAMAAHRTMHERLALLEQARKKATQKVNLYEKVQIPALEDGIRQIKRYLEDEDNLSKAGQKLLKTKLNKEVAS
ncbi:MAG: V-type ATP synthase subunit D [Bacteroidales bacterium]|jgi:V/A-type H+-transporting ATPase subunit D|nr:V-type ATP synthase subunit D [Bacteroidales bacterium]